MIQNFRHKGLKLFFETGSTAGIQATHAAKLGRMLNRLNVATDAQAMNLPGWKLHPLKGAQQLGVNRVTLSRVLNGHAAISPEMAFRIEAWLGKERGGDARLWLAEQLAYDAWQAEQRLKCAPLNVQRAPAELTARVSAADRPASRRAGHLHPPAVAPR
jgi:addiction module HigA family antidote